MAIQSIVLLIPLACLAAAILAGIAGKVVGRVGAHAITITAVALAFGLSVYVYADVMAGNSYNISLYTWGISNGVPFEVGFLIDQLTVTMMVVVTFVSFMVHVYTIGYMAEDPGYQRFFSYIALFTFSMLMLVMANNFLQLFFGWEAVGLVSYLLIGFWFKRDSAVFANLKAFLVNRVGDFAFLLGIAATLYVFGSLDYQAVFAAADQAKNLTVELFPGSPWHWLSIIAVLLFIGAMAKSAQMPLHVWLPDSMEGPTPISALIHAATMVTAGIFMVARMSPIFDLSEAARTMVLWVGGSTAFFMALVGVVQTDIKRVVAYSTLSQLGYMTVALGASAYAAGIFHLTTHAFFKALLFLGAGSVIIAMHHDQDMRNMGGIKRWMPITYLTMVIGSLALAGIPPFAGFFSKDVIIEAVGASQLPGSGVVHLGVLAAVFVTALYSFRLLFLVFHGKPRMEQHVRDHIKESPWVVTLPLVLLAIPALFAGMYYFEPMIIGQHFGASLVVSPENDTLEEIRAGLAGYSGWNLIFHSILEGFIGAPFWLAVAGAFTAWYLYIKNPRLPGLFALKFNWIYYALTKKYGFDEFNQTVFAGGTRGIGNWLWKYGDVGLIDGAIVNGTANRIIKLASSIRRMQTGFLYHYAFVMIIGVFAMMSWFLFR